MFSEYVNVNVSDFVRKGQAALDDHDYARAVEEAFRAVDIKFTNAQDDTEECLHDAVEVIKVSLEKLSASDKSPNDDMRTILPLCKMALCRLEWLEFEKKNLHYESDIIDIETQIGKCRPTAYPLSQVSLVVPVGIPNLLNVDTSRPTD